MPDVRTRLENLLPGDIIGITNNSMLAGGIKGMTWGWQYFFSQSKASHIIVVGQTTRGPIRFVEMEGNGIQDNSPNECDFMPGRDHIVWVGRFSWMTTELRVAFNNELNHLLEKCLNYSFVQIADFITESFGVRLHDRPNHEICSMLPAIICDKIRQPRPQMISGYVAPKNWQCFYTTMINISPSVIGPAVIKAIM